MKQYRSRSILMVFGCVGVLTVAALTAHAQARTVGLMMNDSTRSFDGYTLFASSATYTTYLINNSGELVHSWPSDYGVGLSAYLLPNGKLLRTGHTTDSSRFVNTGGAGGVVQVINWDGSVYWQYQYATDLHRTHHDVRLLPNGNILLIAWELKTASEAIAAGRNPALLTAGEIWPDHIIEVLPRASGRIVWEWHIWDHLIQDFDSTKNNYGIVAEHPELIDVNYISTIFGTGPGADWTHVNAIDYNESLDQIVLSSREFDEIWVIDHSTTKTEAAGHSGGLRGRGGDLLFRWGNPSVYHRGLVSDHHFFGQHNVNWIPNGYPGAGDLMVFNNGLGRPGGYHSSIDQFTPPWDSLNGLYLLSNDSFYEPANLSWTYVATPPDSFFSPFISGASRMMNGNTLICSGWNGTFSEVTPSGETVWKYINPVIASGPLTQGDTIPGIGFMNGKQNMVFRIYRYAPDYPGLAGRDLTPQGPIELYPSGVVFDQSSTSAVKVALLRNTPNPFIAHTTITYQLASSGPVQLRVYNLLGEEVRTLVNGFTSAGVHQVNWNGKNNDGNALSPGIYLYRLVQQGASKTGRMVMMR